MTRLVIRWLKMERWRFWSCSIMSFVMVDQFEVGGTMIFYCVACVCFTKDYMWVKSFAKWLKYVGTHYLGNTYNTIFVTKVMQLQGELNVSRRH